MPPALARRRPSGHRAAVPSEREHLSAGLRVPDPDFTIAVRLPAAGDVRPVRAEAHSGKLAREAGEILRNPARLHVPEPDGSADAGADQTSAVRAEAHPGRTAVVTVEGVEAFAGGGIPHLDRAVRAGAGQASAIRTEAHSGHAATVSTKGQHGVRSGPDPDRGVAASGGETRPVRAERHAGRACPMDRQRGDFPAGRRVPDLDRPVRADAGDPPAVGAIAHPGHRLAMAGEDDDLPAGDRVPDADRPVLAAEGDPPAVGAVAYLGDEVLVKQGLPAAVPRPEVAELDAAEVPLAIAQDLEPTRAVASLKLGRRAAELAGVEGHLRSGELVVRLTEEVRRLGGLLPGDSRLASLVPGLPFRPAGLVQRPGGQDPRCRHSGRQHECHHRRQGSHGRIAAYPLRRPFHGPDRPGQDRFAGQHPAEVFGQGLRRGITPGRVLVQALQTDRLQVARHGRIQSSNRDRIVGQDLVNRLGRRRSAKGRPAGQSGVQDRPQRVDIDRRAEVLLASRLLGRHVRRRADHRPGSGSAVLVESPSQAEVGDLELVDSLRRRSHGDQHVGRLQVSVDDAGVVGGVDRISQGTHHFRRLARCRWPIAEASVERSAFTEFEGHERSAVVFADRVHLDDARVAELGDRLSLAQEPRPFALAGVVPGQDHLQGDVPVEGRVPREVDDAHPAPTQFSQDLVARRRARIRARVCPGREADRLREVGAGWVVRGKCHGPDSRDKGQVAKAGPHGSILPRIR